MTIDNATIGHSAFKNLNNCNNVTLYARFSKSCYFQCENGDFIMLSDKKYKALSFAISVDNPLDLLERLGDIGSKISLDVSGEIWQPDYGFDISYNSNGMKIIEEKLTDFDDVFHDKINEIKPAIICAAKEENAEETLSVLNRFLGLGQGLTPSADDWTFAFFYTLKKTGRGKYAKKICVSLPELAKKCTSFASYAYLSSLKTDDSVEIISDLLKACSSNDPNLASLCDILTDVGSSSGQDMLLGVYDALLLM